jgi:hypothetical protein
LLLGCHAEDTAGVSFNDLSGLQDRMPTLWQDRNGLQRFRCPECSKTYAEERQMSLGAMHDCSYGKGCSRSPLSLEGSSVGKVERITELH